MPHTQEQKYLVAAVAAFVLSPNCSRFNRNKKGNMAEAGRSDLSPKLPVELAESLPARLRPEE
jgi:hypothetical protein